MKRSCLLITLISQNKDRYPVDRDAALQSETIRSLMQNPISGEATLNEIPFKEISSDALSPQIKINF